MRTRRTYAPGLREKVVALALDGTAIVQLARQYDVNVATVHSWVKQARVEAFVRRATPRRCQADPSSPIWQAISHTDPRPAHQQISDRLRAAIATDVLRPGVLLPSNADMAACFGVSNTSVRHAMSTLELEGITNTRQGVGTIVTEPQKPNEPPAVRFEVIRGRDAQLTLVMDQNCTPADVSDMCIQLLFTLSDLPCSLPKITRAS